MSTDDRYPEGLGDLTVTIPGDLRAHLADRIAHSTNVETKASISSRLRLAADLLDADLCDPIAGQKGERA
jgi:hypothetical protein